LAWPYGAQEACRADKDKEKGAAGGEAASAGGAGAGTASRARQPEGRSEDHGGHDGGSAAEAGEGEAKRHERARKGRASGEAVRASQDVVAERRGQQASQGKADDAGAACAEGDAAAGAERRKSTRASGFGGDGGVGATAGDAGNGGNGEVEVGLRRRSKGGGVQSDKEAEEARPPDEVRDAKTERKGRGSKGQQEAGAAEAKADARGNESKDAKDDVKKGKRKLDAGDVKVEKPAAGDGCLQAEQDKTDGKSEGEGDGEESKLRAKDDAQVLDKDDDKHDKKTKKGKRESRDDKDKDRDRDKSAGAAAAAAAPCADKGGVESAAAVEKPPDKAREKSKSKEESEQQEDASKPPADRKQEGSQREEPRRLGAGQGQARGKESKEKKRSSAAKGSWELAALQADVSKSDMLSSIADTGKRRVVPATYFTYDDTGNQAELTKDMHKNVLNVHKSPDRGEAQQRAKARELAGPGVEASRGRRGAVDTPVQEEAPRRERQVPDRYEVAPAPKAKRAKGAAASAGGAAGVSAAVSSAAVQASAPAKSSGGSRRGVTGAAGKETQGGDAEAGGDKRQSRDTTVAGSRAAAVPCDEQAKPDKGVGGAALDGDGMTSMDHGSGARAKGCKATARKEEEGEQVGEDASDSHAARASRKRAARKEDDGGAGDGAHGGQGSGAGAGGPDEAGGGSGAPRKKKGRSSAASKDQAAGTSSKDSPAASAPPAMSASARPRDEHGGAAAMDAQPHAADDSELDTSRLGQTDDEARGDEDEVPPCFSPCVCACVRVGLRAEARDVQRWLCRLFRFVCWQRRGL
jgi:hypothetical protein